VWLLWILFVGAAASNGRPERFWFVKGLGNLCKELEAWNLEQLRDYLGRVVLQEIFFEFHLISIWDDVTFFWELESAVPVADGVLDLGLVQAEVPLLGDELHQ
jgi:hypothetical protein